MTMRTFARLATVVLPAWLLALAASAGAGDAYDPRRVVWTRLELEAHKLFLSARSQVRLRSVPAVEAAGEWIESPHGAGILPHGPRVFEVRIDTAMMGRESTDSVWFDPRHVDAFQRIKVRLGKKGYRKVIRYSDEGTFVRRTAPTDHREARRPFADWSKLETFFYPHPEGDGCRHVTEPSVLFYLLAADPDLAAAGREKRRVCVYSGDTVIPLAIAVEGTEKLAVDYVDPAVEAVPGGREVDVWRVALRPFSADGDFELLGLDGDVEVLIEQISRLPVEVRGRISGLGRVAVKLKAVERGQL
jgi:hypothetical protein